jgi:hypothetical protein
MDESLAGAAAATFGLLRCPGVYFLERPRSGS